jgi:hypothetical protein
MRWDFFVIILEIQFYFINFVLTKMVSWYKYDFVLGAAVSSRRETFRGRNHIMKKGILLIVAMLIFFSMKAEKRAYHLYYDIGGAKFVSIYPDNDPWILTNNKILLRYENNQWKTVAHNHKIDFDTIKVDAQNKVWAMKHFGKQLYFLKNNTWDSIAFNDSIQQAITFNIDRNGNPFIITLGGIWSYEVGNFKRVLYKKTDSTYYSFNGIFFDRKNNWYALSGNTIIKNPRLNPTKLDFPNAGIFRGIDEQENIYYQTADKISIYQSIDLVKEVTVLYSNLYKTIWAKDPNDFYLLGNKFQLHYNGDKISIDSNSKGIFNGDGYIDKNGDFWKSTNRGIVAQTGDSIINFKPQDLGLRSESIIDIAKLEEGYLIAYADSLPTFLNQGKYYHYDSSYTSTPLKSIVRTSSNTYWAKGNDSLYEFKSKHWKKYTLNGNSVHVNTLCKTHSGGLAVFSKDKIIRFDPEATTIIPFPFKPFISKTGGDCSMLESKNGVLWIGIFQQGLYKFENEIWTEFCLENTTAFPVSNTLGLATDSFSNVYTACLVYGLLKHDGEQFQLFDTINSNTRFPSKISVGIDYENKLWCSDYDKGVEYFDGINFEILDIDYNHQIHRTWVDDNNDKWFLSNGLISIYNEKDESAPPIPTVTPMSETISFYPNPTSETITIQNLLADDRIQLFDLSGRKLIDYSPGKEGDEVMNLTSLNRGLYLMNVNRKNQAYFQAKVLKE